MDKLFACHVSGCRHAPSSRFSLKKHVWAHIAVEEHELAGCSDCESLILVRKRNKRSETVDDAIRIRDRQLNRKKQQYEAMQRRHTDSSSSPACESGNERISVADAMAEQQARLKKQKQYRKRRPKKKSRK